MSDQERSFNLDIRDEQGIFSVIPKEGNIYLQHCAPKRRHFARPCSHITIACKDRLRVG